MKKNKTYDVIKNIRLAFFLNAIFSLFELLGGIFTNSISILSNGIRDLGDAIAIAISMVLEKKSRKHPNKNYTFGYLRFSVLGAFITATILLIGLFIIIYNALGRLMDNQIVNYNGMIFLAIIGTIVNFIALKRTAHSDNLNEKAVNLQMLGDVLGWIVILIGAVIIKIFGFYMIDPILSIVISIFILINVIKNYYRIFNVFLEKVPNNIDVTEIRRFLKENKVVEIKKLHIWTMDGINNYATLDIVLDSDISIEEMEKIKNDIRKKLSKFNIRHCVIEEDVRKAKK